MNGPKRFLASGGLKADLLASARTDRPSQGSRRRALVAAGAAAAATSSAGMALGSSVGGTVVRWAVWKWVAAGLASTAVVVTARTVLTPAPDVDTHTVVAQSDVAHVTPGARTKLSGNEASRNEANLTDNLAKPAEEAPPAALAPASVEVVTAPKKMVRAFTPALSTNPRPEKVEAVAAPAPAPPASSQLATEIATLDQAKHAVKSGDATRALHILDSYDATFSHGALAPEASALRIEALARAGRHTEARSELGAFRASHPESPLLGVLSGIVGEGS